VISYLEPQDRILDWDPSNAEQMPFDVVEVEKGDCRPEVDVEGYQSTWVQLSHISVGLVQIHLYQIGAGPLPMTTK
jgi:hypothetical protein